MSMSAEESKDIVRRGMEALFTADGDLDSLDETYAQDYVGHAPPFPDIVGLQAAKGFAMGYRQAFPDLDTTTEDLISEGDKVVVRWTVRGALVGTMEVWLEPVLDGTLLHYFLRADFPPGVTGKSLKEIARRQQAAKAVALDLKFVLEDGRRPGVAPGND